MANPEHLKMIKRGVAVWNRWRLEHPEIRPNLRYADFENADLSYVDLSYVDLTFAKLTSTILISANLKGTNLKGVNLRDVDLSNADLSESNLAETELSYTTLKCTNFNYAHLSFSTFAHTDLSEAIGLETVRHYGPSDVGINTIYSSQGKIPEVFLRGCGVWEEFISYMHSLIEHPIQFYSCFISYSSKDQGFAECLHIDLQNKGVRCWFAPKDLKIGDRFRDRIDESIRLHDKLLLILSEHSVSSPWVSDEVEAAIEREHREGRTVLFPIKIDDAVMGSEQAWAASIRRTRHIGDFTRWKDHDSYQKAFERLLRDLKAEEKKP